MASCKGGRRCCCTCDDGGRGRWGTDAGVHCMEGMRGSGQRILHRLRSRRSSPVAPSTGVEIHPRIDHITLDEQTWRLNLSPNVRIARSKLLSFYYTFSRCSRFVTKLTLFLCINTPSDGPWLEQTYTY
jgi:hypothetical protein